MKILYLSCHSILEYDEIKLLDSIGHEVFSHGTYADPSKVDDPKRPTLNIPSFPDLIEKAKIGPKENLHPDLVDWADCIISMHNVDWLSNNWSKFKGKRVIWRSIGQSTSDIETLLWPLRRDGLQIIRYSPREKTIPGFVGEDVMIRFYKDPDEFKGYTGEKAEIITVAQSFQQRFEYTNWDIFNKIVVGLPARVYGPHNEGTGHLNGGCPDYEGLKNVLRTNRAFFYTGTYPAAYTLGFIEAFMTGIPIIALGPFFGNSPYYLEQKTYEVCDFIKNGENGFISDDFKQLRGFCEMLLKDSNKALHVGLHGRATAIELFGLSKIKKEWEAFLK
jgi:hypothetical protein